MLIKRLTVAAALASLLLVAGSLQAKVVATVKKPTAAVTHITAKTHAPAKHKTAKTHVLAASHSTNTARAKAKSHAKAKAHRVASSHTKTHARRVAQAHTGSHAVAETQSSDMSLSSTRLDTGLAATPAPALLSQESTFSVGPSVLSTAAEATNTANQSGDLAALSTSDNVAKVTDLRKALIGLAMNLRDTRYVRGGRDPSTGFDCSGFVRYVFAHAIGMKLPTNSASQFLAGLKVDRADMKPGDLVFFRTGRKHLISHVGIYLSNGRFIHSPASGKTVQVSSLSESYWAQHFAGAKRPSGIVAAADNG